jgi:site-specific DNA recombinase
MVRQGPSGQSKRARYLFSGLMQCGVCSGGFSKISQRHFGCSTARNKGPTACTNLRTIRRDELEETVLGALRERLMDPDLFKAFAEAFTAEWNRLQGNTAAEQTARASNLQRVRQQIDRLVGCDHRRHTRIRRTRSAGYAREATVDARSGSRACSRTGTPRLHPNLAEVYRQKVANLIDALAQEDAAEARELVRSLVESVRLHPDGNRQRIEVRGELATILGLASGARDKVAAVDSGRVAGQIKMVAGAGFEPAAFRL